MDRPEERSVSFGPFRLFPTIRRVEKNGAPLPLGDRALDILIVLIEHAGEVVSTRELQARVWRNLVVDPSNLRVHVSALRKTLGDADNGAPYIRNVTGQGYSFVAPVHHQGDLPVPSSPSSAPSNTAAPAQLVRTLPPVPHRMVGRAQEVEEISAALRARRFVTLVGPGGIGKTTVAVSVAHHLLAKFDGMVCFVELSSLTDGRLLVPTIASTLHLPMQGADGVTTLMAFLQDTRLLLVLDNCEHLVEAVASLTEMIHAHASEVTLLATSREALRADGEHVHLLPPLAVPPSEEHIHVAEALAYPAVSLFVERASASDHAFVLTEDNVGDVSSICRQLDGIPLAVELVAGRIGVYGLPGTSALLNTRLGLHWKGRRTALPRHQTLHALLDWSYNLLEEDERRTLRALSVFVGSFTLDAAMAVAADPRAASGGTEASLDQLITKSLISATTTSDGAMQLRLLETTRLYAYARIEENGEKEGACRRHAAYYIHWLGDHGGVRPDLLGNLRVALEWSHEAAVGNDDRTSLALALTTAALPTFLALSLWEECRKWSTTALALLGASALGSRQELILQDTLALSSLLTNSSDAHQALLRGLSIARQLEDTGVQIRLLGALHVYLLRMTDFRAGLAIAESMDALATATGDLDHRTIADWVLGSSHYTLGHPIVSRRHFQMGFERGSADHYGPAYQIAGLYYRTRALYGLARVHWLCGNPDQALEAARRAVSEASSTASPINVSYALVHCCYIHLWCGDFDGAGAMIDRVTSQPHWQGRLVWLHSEAQALRGELLVRRGRLQEGIDLLRRALSDMRSRPQKNLMQSVTACGLAEGLLQTGHADDALSVINEAIAHSPGIADTWDGPEVLRIRAEALACQSGADDSAAEACALEALDIARKQGATGWELRVAMTLARLCIQRDRVAEARAALLPVYSRYTEGFDTLDLRLAQQLLETTAPSH